MGVTGSKVFVNRMLRNSGVSGEEDGNKLLRHTGHEGSVRFNTITSFEDSIDHQLSNSDDEKDEANKNILLSLVAHHVNVRRQSKKEELLQVLQKQLT